MLFRIWIIFLSAEMCAASSISQTRDSETVSIPVDIDGSNQAIIQQRERILTGRTNQPLGSEPGDNQHMVTCDRWYISIDGRIQCQVTKSTKAPSNDFSASENLKQPMHVYLPGIPTFGIPIWSSSFPDQTYGASIPYRRFSPKGVENDSEPDRGHGETLPLKPVIHEPVHIVPKPIVVHKPVWVPKPIEITVHKPVLVHKPIEIHKPAVIHKPIEIPYHKPIFIQKPLEITVHKPVLVHQPFDIKPVESNHESLLSHILKQHSSLFHVPQRNPQYFPEANNPHTHLIKDPGYVELHQTGFVSAHDSGKDATMQRYGSEPSGQDILQNAFSPGALLLSRTDALTPSPVKEFNTDIRATDKISSVDHLDSNVKSQTDQVVEGVIKTIKQNNEEMTKSVFSESVDDQKNIHSILGETEFGRPNEPLRNALNFTSSKNMELEGSQVPLSEPTGTEIYHLEDEETDPSLEPPLNPHEMPYEKKATDSDMVAETKLEEGPDVMENAQKEEGEELSRTIREAPGVPFDDVLRDKQRAGTILDRTTLLEIMTALKDQYLRNAEPDQRKVIEDAFDRLYSSVRNMKQLEERPKWKEIDGSKKAALELLAERAPVDVDEWDYYSDAADDVSAEPSFLELLNVATKHKGKQTEVNR